MSQTFSVPMAGSQTLVNARTTLNDALDTIRSNFSGTSAPSSPSPVTGQMYFNTTDNTFYAYTGTVWVAVAGPISASSGGTILADGSNDFAADQSMGSNKLTNLASGTATADAVNKGQVDARREMAVVRLGDVSASVDAYVFALGVDATITNVTLATSASLTSNATDKWTINVRNLTGSVDLRSADYDTDSDGDFTADARSDLGLDQNLAITAGHLLELQIVKNGSIGNLADLTAFIEFTVAL